MLNYVGRGEKTRTSGLYVPNVARYQLRHTPSVLRLQKYTFFEIKCYFDFFCIFAAQEKMKFFLPQNRHLFVIALKNYANEEKHIFDHAFDSGCFTYANRYESEHYNGLCSLADGH